MKITTERSYLTNALGVARRAVSSRNTLPILSHVLIQTEGDRLKITATDLDTAIHVHIPAQVAESGAVAIPAAQLADWVSKLADAPVTLEEREGKVEGRSGKAKFNFQSAPAQDFPDVPAVTNGTEITLPASALKDAIRLTAFAASKEEHKSILMGVLFEARGSALTLVATDTHRLAQRHTPLDAEVRASVSQIIPAKPLRELESVLKNAAEAVTIRFGASQVQFESDTVTLVSRVLDGQFPNYEKVIPATTERKVSFDRSELLGAVRRVDIVSSTASQKMAARFSSSTLTMNAESSESGNRVSEEVGIEMEGDELSICFNAKYLLEVLSTLSADTLKWELNGALQPSILREGDDFLYIVMPMQA